MRWRRAVTALALLLAPGGAAAEEPSPQRLRDLLGDLAAEADRLPSLYPITAPAPPWVDEFADLDARGRLASPEEVARARGVVERLRAHAAAGRLESLGRQTASNLALDPALGAYVHTVVWSPPFLLAASDGTRYSDREWLALPDEAARRAKRAEIRALQASWTPLLERHAAAAQAVYRRVLAAAGERLRLRPLEDPWGGAPDLPEGVRSFRDGVPLRIWVFPDRATAQREMERLGSPVPAREDLFGEPARTGWILTHASGEPGDVARRVGLAAAQQALLWFTRQRSRWKAPARGLEAASEGWTRWAAGFSLQSDGSFRFSGVDPRLLAEMQGFAAGLGKRGREYPFFPVASLFEFRTPGEAMQDAGRRVGVDTWTALLGLRQEAWALVLWLDTADGGARRETLWRLLDALLDRRSPSEAYREAVPEGAREDVEAAFLAFLRDDLLKRDPAAYADAPGALPAPTPPR